MMARSLLFVHRTNADFAISFQWGTSHSPSSGCPRAEPRRRVALAKRAALEISVSPLDSIRRSRQPPSFPARWYAKVLKTRSGVSKLDVFWADLHTVGATHSTDMVVGVAEGSDQATLTT